MILYCSRCNQDKLTDDFYKCKTAKTGFLAWCKQCYKEHNERARKPVHTGIGFIMTHHEKEKIMAQSVVRVSDEQYVFTPYTVKPKPEVDNYERKLVMSKA